MWVYFSEIYVWYSGFLWFKGYRRGSPKPQPQATATYAVFRARSGSVFQ